MSRYCLPLALMLIVLSGSAWMTETGMSLQDEQADVKNPPAIEGAEFTNSSGMTFIRIKPGKFWIGSQGDEAGRESDESPQRLIRFEKDYFLGRTEVTQAQWMEVMETRPWSGRDFIQERGYNPAIYISWEDAVAFCEKLSEQDGRNYRLPTEAEWEYACRAGTTTRYSFGDDESDLNLYAWWERNSFKREEKYAHRVATKKPNPWGLYDMHGNVLEWCQDWYLRYSLDPTNEDDIAMQRPEHRVLRGGSWLIEAHRSRSANREYYEPRHRSGYSGFRVLLEVDEKPEPPESEKPPEPPESPESPESQEPPEHN